MQVNVQGIVENVDADGEVEQQNDGAADPEAQDPGSPPGSRSSSVITLAGSRVLNGLDSCDCTPWQIMLFAFMVALLTVGLMFLYWEYTHTRLFLR